MVFQLHFFRRLSHASVVKGLIASSFLTLCDRSEEAKIPTSHLPRQKNCPQSQSEQFYPHVIVGLGTAGMSALQEILKSRDHSDKILVIDPNVRLKNRDIAQRDLKQVDFQATHVKDLDYSHKLIELADGSLVRYSNCLISVGSSAAPYNPQFVDSECNLEDTIVDLTHPNAPYKLFTSIVGTEGLFSPEKGVSKNDTQGVAKSVALVGANCWETVELAGKLAMAAEFKHQEQKTQQVKSTSSTPHGKGGKGKFSSTNAKAVSVATPKDIVSLIYPAYGPMSHTLPRYLSLALSKRLQRLGVHLVPYSYVRYLGPLDRSYNMQSLSVLFLAKTYDSLNTQSFVAHQAAFAPTAVPTQQDREALHRNKTHTLSEGGAIKSTINDAHVHGFLLRSGLELDKVSGGVVVNQSLQACEGLFVAGDVASVYVGAGECERVDLRQSRFDKDGNSEKSVVAKAHAQQRGLIRGHHNALYSGTVAGRNMACSLHSADSNKQNDHTYTPLLYDHIPLYEAHSADIGVHFSFVGNCSSALETHGFWWKFDKHSEKAVNNEALTPPLGLGVVFYLSHGVVVGVLISGLSAPSTSSGSVYGTGTSSGGAHEANSPAHTDSVHALCKQLIGQSVMTLEGYKTQQQSDGARNGAVKRQHLSRSYEVAGEPDTSVDEASLYQKSLQQPEKAVSVADTATALAPAPTPTPVYGADLLAADVYTSQALSWEARRLIAPVLSASLYTKVLAGTTGATDTNGVELSLSKAMRQYPTPLYRYCGPAQTTVKDLTEPLLSAVVRPAVCREMLFQPEFANTGSKADNLQAAYRKSIAKSAL